MDTPHPTTVPFDGSDMGCHPSELRPLVRAYRIPSCLGKTEAEEAAARILLLSITANQWVGVSWPCLLATIIQELEVYRAAKYDEHQISDYNFGEDVRVAKARRVHVALSFLTVGVYALIVSWPKPSYKIKPDIVLPISGIYSGGPQHVTAGIHELLNRDLLRQERVTASYRSEPLDVFFPTPALIEAISEYEEWRDRTLDRLKGCAL